MINIKLIYKIIGQLLLIEATFMFVCLLCSLYYNQEDIYSFIIAIAITLVSAFTLKFFGRNSSNSMSRRDAFLIVTASWIIFSIFGSIPFMIGNYIPEFVNAFFETMSGFTTTGATIIDDVQKLPHGILFWRSLTHWIGGLGIVFFTIAILPSLVGGNVRIFSAEATGPIRAKLHPRISTNAKWILAVYLFLTVACAFFYFLGGMNIFDSINYSMSTIATGGFSPHNESLSYFKSPTLEYISILFQFLAGINFTLLYLFIFKTQIKSFFKNSELAFYLSLIIISSLSIVIILMTKNNYELEPAIRSALFQSVSFMTTTGLFSDNVGNWPHITWVILGILMFIGACSGSTSGGYKCIRALMVFKVMANELKRALHPRAVLPVKIDKHSIPSSAFPTLLAFSCIYILACLFTATIMIIFGVDHTNAITISLSCISNVGPTLGTQIGPVMSWHSLPDIVKWICSILMLMGRLEILSVLVLFSPAFWKNN